MSETNFVSSALSRAKLKHDGGIKRVMNSSIAPTEIARRMSLAIVTSRAIIPAVEDQGVRVRGVRTLPIRPDACLSLKFLH